MPILKDEVVGFKVTKKAEDLSTKEWELYCKNVLYTEFKRLEVFDKFIAIKNEYGYGVTFSRDVEINMLGVYGEEI